MQTSNQVKVTLKSLRDSNSDKVVVDTALESRLSFFEIEKDDYTFLKNIVTSIKATDYFKGVIDYFDIPEGETPAGFKFNIEYIGQGVLEVNLVRDISYGKNGEKRPTDILFSADSANPYEIEPIKDLIANLTCNPGIIYDLFINNPKANIDNKFKTRDDVMEEIGNILGPGVDISVELNDPFNSSDEEILEEAAKFKKMLSEYRLVIKVPHTSIVNKDNVHKLLEGDKKLESRYDEAQTKDAFRGHQIALMLQEHGYRINFTLMFEPYQTNLALQARPYFINSFIRHRLIQSQKIADFIEKFEVKSDDKILEDLRAFLIDSDYLALKDKEMNLFKVKELGDHILKYREFYTREGEFGLDSVRHNLRLLKQTNLKDTRLIICSMEGDINYPMIDKLLTEPEFSDLLDRVVITAEPKYLARFTSTNQVVQYQRRFMTAASGQK